MKAHQGNLTAGETEHLRTLLEQVSRSGSSISRHTALDLLMLLPETEFTGEVIAMETPVEITKPTVYPLALWHIIEVSAGKQSPDRLPLFDQDFTQTFCTTSIHAIVEGFNNPQECAAAQPSTMEIIENSVLAFNWEGRGKSPMLIPLSFIQTHVVNGVMGDETYFYRGMRTTQKFPADGMQELRSPRFILPSTARSNGKGGYNCFSAHLLSEPRTVKHPVRIVILLDGYTNDDPYQLESDRILARSTVLGPGDPRA